MNQSKLEVITGSWRKTRENAWSESRLVLVLLLIGWKIGGKFLSQSCSVANTKPIGHFRVLLCLCFKTSLSAKPFIGKWVLHAVSFSCKSKSLKQRHKGTRKWPNTFRHSNENRSNAPINGLSQDEGGGGGGRKTQGKFDIFRFSNINFPTLGSHFKSNFHPWGPRSAKW